VPRKPIKRNFDTIKDAVEVVQLVPSSHYTLLKEEGQSYERITKIGQGTFGEVFKCRCKSTGKLVAIKRIIMEQEREGFPITALREIKMLKLMRHVNVTELVDICVSTSNDGKEKKPQFFLVFAFCDHDLAGILNKKELKLEAVVVKTMLKHMFEGLNFIHGCKVLHRDMKTANILLSRDGYLKLADFGLARPMVQDKCYTNKVVTLWYRPPELLLGEKNYDAKIDIWGAGCIMIEFWTRAPIFQGSDNLGQLKLIMRLCGPITPKTFPRAESLPDYRSMVIEEDKYKRSIIETLGKMVMHHKALDLINQCLSLDPEMRPSAAEALDHEYFHSEPLPMRNVVDFVSTLKSSFFEFTINRGPRPRPAGGVPPPRMNRPNQKPPTQFFDRIY